MPAGFGADAPVVTRLSGWGEQLFIYDASFDGEALETVWELQAACLCELFAQCLPSPALNAILRHARFNFVQEHFFVRVDPAVLE